jgi:hypothetical protein
LIQYNLIALAIAVFGAGYIKYESSAIKNIGFDSLTFVSYQDKSCSCNNISKFFSLAGIKSHQAVYCMLMASTFGVQLKLPVVISGNVYSLWSTIVVPTVNMSQKNLSQIADVI